MTLMFIIQVMPNIQRVDQELLLHPKYPRRGWIGVDLDGTLAMSDPEAEPHCIGIPVPHMMKRVQHWIETGRTVKIFTARAGNAQDEDSIHQWCIRHGLPKLEITNRKDHKMIALWDDRAVGVVKNTGLPILPVSLSLWQSVRLRLAQMIGGSAFMEADRRQLKDHFPVVTEAGGDLCEFGG
jgi:hypothetical protein